MLLRSSSPALPARNPPDLLRTTRRGRRRPLRTAADVSGPAPSPRASPPAPSRASTWKAWRSALAARRPAGWPRACDVERAKGRSERAAAHAAKSPREHAMMFAFALAIVGVAVLAAMNHAAARAS